MKRAVYTYWTNNGTNYLTGFNTKDSFVKTAKESISQAKKYFSEVVVYTDQEGAVKLEELGVDINKEIIDYSQYEFNKNYWNFPKIITYSLQKERFLHLDFDFILDQKPSIAFLSSSLACEKIRALQQFSKDRKFLPKTVKDNFSPFNICSGALGGNPEIYKKLFMVSSELVKKMDATSPDKLFIIEEVVLTALAKINEITPYALDTDYTHHQGDFLKQELTQIEIPLTNLKL